MKGYLHMSKVQFGWVLPIGSGDYLQGSEYLAEIQRGFNTIQGHFDSAWFIDHLQFDDSYLLEAWTALAYIAALYPQFSFGHTVLCQAYRNPALLAKMAATLQYLSDGRFILGLGAGWKEDEYKAYGYNFPSAGKRIQQLDEALHIIKDLWEKKEATFQGKFSVIENAICEPKPKPLPTIMIGGARPHILQVIARHADWWNVSWVGIDDYREIIVRCKQICEDANRDPLTLRRTWYGACVCAPTDVEVKALNNRHLSSQNAFVGTPTQVIDQIGAFIDMGVDYFMLENAGFPDNTTLQLLVEEVLPVFISRDNISSVDA